MSVHAIHQGDDLAAAGWQGKLERAQLPSEIVDIARDYLASLTPYEVEVLPDSCEPPAVLSRPDDVSAFAYELARHSRAIGVQSPEVIARMSSFFSHACHGLSRLSTRRAKQMDDRESA